MDGPFFRNPCPLSVNSYAHYAQFKQFGLIRVKPNEEISTLYMPVLEPDLHHPHIEACILAELFTYVTGWFRTGIVSLLKRKANLLEISLTLSLISV